MPKTKKQKIFIASVILLGGIVSAFFVLRSTPGTNSILGLSFGKDGSSEFGYEKKYDNKIGNSEIKNIDNLTTNLIDAYAYEIAKKNPTGPQLLNNEKRLTMPSGNTLDSAFQKELSQKIQISQIEETDIKTSNDNSANAIRSYILALNNINTKNSKGTQANIGVLINEMFSKNNPDPLFAFVNKLKNGTNEILALSVPSSWKDLHIKLINLQQKKIAVFESMLEVEDDPVKTISYVEKLDEIIKEDQDLALLFKEKAKMTISMR